MLLVLGQANFAMAQGSSTDDKAERDSPSQPPAKSQPPAPLAQYPVDPAASDEDSPLFLPGSVERSAKLDPEMERRTGLTRRLGFRPMLQWYHWANKPRPFFKSLLFILLYSVVAWSMFPAWLQAAQATCRQKFWSSLGVGCLVVMVGVTLARIAVMTGLGAPLGLLVGGLLELALLCGLSVVSSMIGQSVGGLLRFCKLPFMDRPDVCRFAQLLLGALICALLLQIPGVGLLPKIGTRFVALLAVLGLGGIYRNRPTL